MPIFVFAAVFTLLFFIFTKLLEALITEGYCTRLLNDQKSLGASLPSKLALAVLPRKRVFRSVSLPIPGKDGEEIQLGTVVVSRAGIFILCQINGSGILENPTDRKWKHILSGKFSEFENPFLYQKDARTLIEYYASSYIGADVHAYTMVLYTSPSLKFTSQKPRGVLSAHEFPKKLKKMERSGRLTAQQVKDTCAMLSRIEAY